MNCLAHSSGLLPIHSTIHNIRRTARVIDLDMSTARRNRDGNSDVRRGNDYHSTAPIRRPNDAQNKFSRDHGTASTITSVGREVANCASTRGRLCWKCQVLLALLVVDKNGLYKTDHRWLESSKSSSDRCVEQLWLKKKILWKKIDMLYMKKICYVFLARKCSADWHKQKPNYCRKDKFPDILIR